MQAANPIIPPRIVPGAPRQPSMPLRGPETLQTRNNKHKDHLKRYK
jgi:hypothetical protein